MHVASVGLFRHGNTQMLREGEHPSGCWCMELRVHTHPTKVNCVVDGELVPPRVPPRVPPGFLRSAELENETGRQLEVHISADIRWRHLVTL